MIRCHLLRAVLLACLLGLGMVAHAQTLFRGMTEAELIEAIGQPVSEMGHTAKKVFIYQGGSAELRQGRLYSVEGLNMQYVTPDGAAQFSYKTGAGWILNGQPIEAAFRFTRPPVNAPPPPDTGVKFYRPGEENQPPPANVRVGTPPAPPPVEVSAPPTVPPPPPPPAKIVEEPLPEEVIPEGFSEMEYEPYDEYDEYDEMYYDEDYELTTTQKAIQLGIQFLIDFALTLLILKIAFENKGFPVLWPQLIPLSLASSVISLGVAFGMNLMEFDIFYLEQAINYLALSGLIYLMTDVTQGTTAMGIALIARGVTIVVNYLLILAFLTYGF